jgi:hypothetical protein
MRCQEIINSAQKRQEVKILDYTKVVDIQILNLEERIFNIMIHLSDGSVQLIQAREGSAESMKLFSRG